MMNLAKNVQVRRLTIDGTNYILAAGTSDVASGAVDTRGFGGVMFIAGVGVIAATGAVTFKGQQSSDLAGSPDAYSDILGAALTAYGDTDDNKIVILDIRLPMKRFVKLATTRGDAANSTVDFIVAILYNPGQAPTALDALTLAQEVFNQPAEGTA
jgi:hypothetical protein